METKPLQCCKRDANLLKTVGQKLEIKTEFVRQTVTRVLEKTVRVGDVLCNKSRVSFYKKKSEETERERREETERVRREETERDRREEAGPSHASNPQDPDMTSAEADPSHASNPQDPEFILIGYNH